jgi:hypothetical protein
MMIFIILWWAEIESSPSVAAGGLAAMLYAEKLDLERLAGSKGRAAGGALIVGKGVGRVDLLIQHIIENDSAVSRSTTLIPPMPAHRDAVAVLSDSTPIAALTPPARRSDGP